MNNDKSMKQILIIYISLSLLVSIIITFFSRLFTDQPALYSYFFIVLMSSIFIITLIYHIRRRFKVPVEFFVLVISIYIFITIGFSYYSYSSDLVTAPYLINYTSEDAKNMLEQNDLIAEISYQPVNSSQLNRVISQDPVGGTLLVKKSKLKIVISQSESVVTINTPNTGDYVQENSSVSGTVQKIHQGDKVYLLIQPLTRSNEYNKGPYRWYVQPTPSQPINIPVKSDGSWSSNAYFGNSGDEGRRFKIVAIVTDQEVTGPLEFTLPSYKSISNEVYVTRM